MSNFLVFDTETTGFPGGEVQAHIMQLAAVLVCGETLRELDFLCAYLQLPAGAVVHPKAAAVTGLTADLVNREGRPPAEVWRDFSALVGRAGAVVGHNIEFDLKMCREFVAVHGGDNPVAALPAHCTMKLMTPHCQIPGKWRGSYKWPTCAEAYRFITCGGSFAGAHDALADVRATAEILRWLVQRRLVRLPDPALDLRATPLRATSQPAPPAPSPAPAPAPSGLKALLANVYRRTANC